MRISMTAIGAAVFLLLSAVTCISSSLPPPSHGDIKLDNESVVLIYMGRGYEYNENMWGTIEFYDSQYRPEVTHTLCHQLGYNDGTLSGQVVDATEYANVPVWLKDLKCTERMSHILGCTHIVHQEKYSDQQIITLTCWNKITEKYEGQISLYRPDGLPPSQSVSTGVISLYSGKDPYFIQADKPLTAEAANTICRQMGFTESRPDSIMNISVAKSSLGYTFDMYFSSDVTLSINASQIKCSQSSECTRCCTNNAIPPQNENPGLPNGALVIQCVFNDAPSSLLLSSEETEKECQISDSKTYNNDGQICGANSGFVSMSNGAFAGMLVGILLAVIALLVVAIIVYKIRRFIYRRGYQQLQNGGQNGGNGGNGGHGGLNGGNGGNGGHGGNGGGD